MTANSKKYCAPDGALWWTKPSQKWQGVKNVMMRRPGEASGTCVGNIEQPHPGCVDMYDCAFVAKGKPRKLHEHTQGAVVVESFAQWLNS